MNVQQAPFQNAHKLSPRLEWMRKHEIKVDQVKLLPVGDDFELLAEDDPFLHAAEDGWRAYTGRIDLDREHGVTGCSTLSLDLEDALYRLAEILGIHAWREEPYVQSLATVHVR